MNKNSRIARTFWTASICHMVTLSDGRVLYLHFEMMPNSEPVWSLHRVVLIEDGVQVGHYDLAPIMGDEPDVLPEWITKIIADVPLTAPQEQAKAADQ